MGFDERAKEWDRSERRQALASAVGDAIAEEIALDPSMRLLDVGAGTGLLTRRLADRVACIEGLDASKGMAERFALNFPDCPVHRCNIMEYESDRPYDGIVSSMTLHHIPSIDALFARFYRLLYPGGFIALADLAPEDGSFHDGGNEGVYHFGFDEKSLADSARAAGFTDWRYRIVHRVKKPRGEYPVFLFCAYKPR